MPKKQKKASSFARSFLKHGFRFLLVFAVVFAGALWFLSTIKIKEGGWANEPLRQGIQGFFSEQMNTNADIENITAFSFFPDIHVALEGLRLRDKNDPEVILVNIEQAEISQRFVDYLFLRGQIKAVSFKNAVLKSGYLTPERMRIESAGIEHKEDTPAQFIAEGVYGSEPFRMSMALSTKDSNGQTTYTVPKKTEISGSLGDMTLDTNLRLGRTSQFEDIVLKAADRSLTGNLSVSNKNPVNVKGAIDFGDSAIKPDLTIGIQKGIPDVSGALVFPVLSYPDIAILSDIQKVASGYVSQKKTQGKTSLNALVARLDVDIQDLKNDKISLGSVKGAINIKNGAVSVKPLQGRIMDGALKTDVVLKENEKGYDLSVDGTLTNIDYTAFQNELEGRANIKFSLGSVSGDLDNMVPGLSGKVTAVAGQGVFHNEKLLDIAGGFIRVALPDFNPADKEQMNCAIADFKIEDGVAHVGTLFADFKDVTFVGSGDINLVERRYNLKINPKAKETALFDVATAVNVTGPFDKPSFAPDAFSLGKKIGGLALGFINPAFLVFSLVDLGLSDNHPCKKYMKEDKNAE